MKERQSERLWSGQTAFCLGDNGVLALSTADRKRGGENDCRCAKAFVLRGFFFIELLEGSMTA